MSTNSNAVAVEERESAPLANEAWILRKHERSFGPLSEDEMRGYFRAGMVSPGDSIAVPGRFGFVPATEAATLLGLPAPVAPALAPPVTSIIYTPPSPRSSPVILVLGALVALVGALYFGTHRPKDRAPAFDEPMPAAVAAQPQPQQAPATQATVAASEEPPPSDTMPAPIPGPEVIATSQPTPSQPPAVVAASTESPAPTAATDFWWTQAQRLVDAADWKGLVVHASKWSVAEPQRDLAWWYLGIAESRAGDDPAAIVAYKQALAITPNHFKVRWALSDSYRNLQQYRESTELLEQLVREAPADPRLRNDIGINLANLGEYDAAVSAFEKAVQLAPGYRKAWANLAQCYAHFGYVDRASDALAHANAH